MKKITLLVFALFLSFSAYCQFPNPGVEGFENTTGPDALPSTVWNLGTGVPGNQWAVFDNGVGTGRWGINNTTVTPPTPPVVCNGLNVAYMNRNQTGGAGLTSQNYLATPKVTVPVNGQLRFVNRTFTAGNNGTFYDVKWAPGTANQTDPAAYTITLATYTEDDLTLDSYSGVQNAFNICTTKIINFPATIPAGTLGYVAFIRRNTQLATAVDGDRWLLDDVQLNSRCLDPTTLGAGPLLCSSATLTWGNPSGASSWEIEVLPAATVATGIGILYNGTLPYVATTTATGTPLTGNTPYKYYVRAVCPGSIPSNWVGPFNFTTTVCPPVCGGNYVDSGGSGGNYGNNENLTTVICPVTSTDQVTVTFTTFNVAAGDLLSIYDGNTATPGALLGTFTGTALPTTFTSSSPSGCLTFVFVSNGSGVSTGWIANVTCAPPPACPKPTALTAISSTATSINLGWTNVGPGTTWQYVVLSAGSPAPTAATVGTSAPTNPFLISGLASGTCFDIYVRADCSSTSNGFSLWSKLNFCTSVAPPICGGNFVDSGGATGAYTNGENITTTICPTNPGEKVTVTFTAFFTEAQFDGLYVYNGSVVTPGALLPSTNPAGFVPGGLAGSYWGNLNANLPGPFTSTTADGCLTFVFRSDGSVTNPGWLGNITCALPPTCQQPTNLTVGTITTTTAQLQWVSPGTATSWQVIALPTGSPAPNAGTTGWTAAPTNPFVLGGLTPGTAYQYYVRGDCGPVNGVSLWSGPFAFSTIPTCPAQTNLTVTAVLTTSVQLNWTTVAPSTAWQVIALPCGSPAPTAAATTWVAAPTNPFVLTGLTAATCYDFYVRGVCSPTDNSFWSPVATATTQALPPVCGGTFTDVGGVAAAYPANSNSTVTICPITPGDQVTVTFTTFNTEAQFDGLYVYNGSVVTPGALQASANPAGFVPGGLAGSYWGNLTGANLPGPFTSSAPDGCLTFVFRSDGSVQNPGWVANITCGPPPTCAKPINLLATVNSSTSATLNWTQPANAGGGTATQWQVIVQPAGGPIPNASTPTTAGVIVNNPPAPPYTVTGLIPGTTYEFYVRAICSPTDNSPWGGPRTFFTQTSCGDSLPFCGNTGLSYTNTTGAPSYGTIGCLGTTPNPAWYFMQVNQSGTLTFQIAQTANGGGGLDVDFITWGPFTPAQYATLCNNLYGYPVGNTGFPTNVVGCSYSTAAVENFTINNAIAGNYYMVLITNFSNQAGSVTFTQTNNGQPGSGTTNCAIVCSVALGSDVVLCNAPSYTINATTQGATAYAWYFNGSTTPIPSQTTSSLVVTQTGDYTCTIQCGLNNATDTVHVTFNAPTAATFVLPSTVCQGLPAPTLPTSSTNATPITGTWSPNIVNTSVLGAVTYTFTPTAGQCASVVTATITIVPASVVTTFDPIPNICQGLPAPALPTSSTNSPAVNGTWSPPTIDTSTVGTTTYTFTPVAGQCATVATLNVTIDAPSIVPTFNAIANICQGLPVPSLPAASTNATPITGTWSPTTISSSTVGTATYTFTPDAGQCATVGTLNVTIDAPSIVPTFNAIANICQGLPVPSLPAASTNATPITGTWSPTTISSSTVGTTTYTFTPDAGQCATVGTLNVTIDAPSIVPTFNAIANICQGFPVPSLPAASTNATPITGTWSPTTISSSTVGTATYTFTPDAGQCAVVTTLNVTIDAPSIVPTFNPIGSICQGLQAPPLPGSSTNNPTPITGTWNPPTISTATIGTTTYTFTPDAGQCAVSTTMNITISNPSTIPTFTPIAGICQGGSAPALPGTSNNNIAGSWNPPTIDTSVIGSVTYTFTPNANQCAVSTTMVVAILAPTTATFTQIAAICQGGTAPALPGTSSNNITGTWNPPTISTANAGTTTYTFTPNAGQCATGTTMTITIHPTPVVASVTNITGACDNYTLQPLTVGNYFSQPNGQSPITNLTLTSSQLVYVYAQSGTTPNCTDEKSFQVTITSSPQFTIEGGCDGSVYVLEVTNANFDTSSASFSWSGPNGPVGSSSPILQVATAGSYTCTVTVPNGGNGCSTSHSFDANDINCIVPKGISPNGDGLNDNFDLSGYNVGKLSIFNRYGTAVYTRNDYKDEWFGQSKSGNELPDGTYYYVIERKDGGDSKTGWIFINREH